MREDYELAPVHPDFAPPSRGVWDWQAIMVKGTGDIVCMVPSRERGEQIMQALSRQAASSPRSELRTSVHDWREW